MAGPRPAPPRGGAPPRLWHSLCRIGLRLPKTYAGPPAQCACCPLVVDGGRMMEGRLRIGRRLCRRPAPPHGAPSRREVHAISSLVTGEDVRDLRIAREILPAVRPAWRRGGPRRGDLPTTWKSFPRPVGHGKLSPPCRAWSINVEHKRVEAPRGAPARTARMRGGGSCCAPPRRPVGDTEDLSANSRNFSPSPTSYHPPPAESSGPPPPRPSREDS